MLRVPSSTSASLLLVPFSNKHSARREQTFIRCTTFITLPPLANRKRKLFHLLFRSKRHVFPSFRVEASEWAKTYFSYQTTFLRSQFCAKKKSSEMHSSSRFFECFGRKLREDSSRGCILPCQNRVHQKPLLTFTSFDEERLSVCLCLQDRKLTFTPTIDPGDGSVWTALCVLDVSVIYCNVDFRGNGKLWGDWGFRVEELILLVVWASDQLCTMLMRWRLSFESNSANWLSGYYETRLSAALNRHFSSLFRPFINSSSYSLSNYIASCS